MAKRTKSQPKEEPEARESFIPQDDPLPEPIVSETEMVAAPDGKAPTTKAELKISKGVDRNVEISLTIPPLQPCVERIFLPLKASQEQIASVIAGAVGRAANSVSTDGVYQHAKRRDEDAEAEKRFAGKT